jgi:hypothetical protein
LTERNPTSQTVSVPKDVAEYALESAMMLRKRLEVAPNSPEYKRVCEVQTALEDALSNGPSEPASLEGIAPQPKYVEHIQFEGRDCVVLSPEEYEALWNIAVKTAPQSAGADDARIDLTRYINASNISAADIPHVVVEKLQKTIDAARSANEAHDGWREATMGSMPFADQMVLVHNGKWTGLGKYVYDPTDFLDDSERWQSEAGEFIEHLGPKVTHWMPLPAAPKSNATSERSA